MTSASSHRLDRLPLAEPESLGLSPRRIEPWIWGFVALGIGLRVLIYLLRFPISTDEAKLAISLLDRGYAGLLEPLAYAQIVPFLFLWIQETATHLFGFHELSLRLVPVLSAVASVLLMRHLARRVYTGMPAVFAVAIFAVSYYPIRHAAELKPYATDLLASLILTAIAVEWLNEPTRARWLWLFAAAAPLAVTVSYPAVFVAVGILVALAVPVWRERRGSGRLALLASAASSATALALVWTWIAGRQFEIRSAAKFPWVGGFPPLDDPIGGLRWLVGAHVGRTFAYPVGTEDGGSILTFAAFAVGTIVMFRAGRKRLLAVLLLPFAAGIAAAILQLYPYGGSGRVSQYLAPGICLLAGLGAVRLLSLPGHPSNRRRALVWALLVPILVGSFFAGVALLRPYRDRPDRAARDFARWFWDVKSRDAELVSAWEDLQLEFARPPDRWIPGAAGFRINQRIYHPRHRRRAAPDLASVSSEHPLRVVFLGSTVDEHPAAFHQWLRVMGSDYSVTGRERHRLGGFREQHGREDRVEVVTFVPLSSAPPTVSEPPIGGVDGQPERDP